MAPSPQLAAPVPYLRIVVADGELFRPSLRAAKRSALRACCRGQAWGEVRRAFAMGVLRRRRQYMNMASTSIESEPVGGRVRDGSASSLRHRTCGERSRRPCPHP